MQVLYGRTKVFRFGLRLVRDEQVAEGLISEVFPLETLRTVRGFNLACGYQAVQGTFRRKDAALDDGKKSIEEARQLSAYRRIP